MAKKYDLAVKVGSYTDKNGDNKNKYRNIGLIMEGKDGLFMMLNRDFNPAGVPFKEGSESILVSMFEPREDDGRGARSGGGGGGENHTAARNSVKSRANIDVDYDDEIPFITNKDIW